MTSLRRLAHALGIGCAVLLIGLVGGCAINGPLGSAAPSCDVDSILQGCGTRPPTFAGKDCAAVGAELGRQLDARLVEILDGPASVYGADRSVLAISAQVYLADRTNRYLRQHQLVEACGADDLLAATVAQMSDRVHSSASILLNDPAATFDSWAASLRRELQVVDDDEDLPYDDPPTSS